jgi:hypothetical protein
MELFVLVEPSNGTDPGHMVIGQESAEGEVKYFGFHFDPDDLPAEFQPKERWQEYLYSNKTPGHISDDLTYVQGLFGDKARRFLEKRVVCDVAVETVIPAQTEWEGVADYSFSPDDFHSDASPCYNCVTWATMIANKLIPDFLTPVRQGRIKWIVKQLRAEAGKTGDQNG